MKPDALEAALRESASASELEIAALKRQLSDTRAELESFTYSVSHDLRASLRHISAYVEIVNEDLGLQVDAGVAAHLRTISGAARHMTLMIDALMELSRLGRVELKPVQLDVVALIAEVRDEVCATMAAELAGRAVEWHVASDFAPVSGDAALVRQLLRHLIANAVKFTRGTEVARIAIGWRVPEDAQKRGQCEWFVRDNGAGFNPQFQGKLFNVFQRLHSNSQFEGLGMGLALARRIVARHGGHISATATVGGGCEVRLTLPLFAA